MEKNTDQLEKSKKELAIEINDEKGEKPTPIHVETMIH